MVEWQQIVMLGTKKSRLRANRISAGRCPDCKLSVSDGEATPVKGLLCEPHWQQRKNREHHERISTSMIVISCYECGTKTLRFDESTRVWCCLVCHRTLTTNGAADDIIANIIKPEGGLTSNFVSLMSGVYSLGEAQC